MTRATIPDFQLANPIYIGAKVYFYTVSAGVKTSTLATLYEGFTGSDTLANPQTLDSEGKFNQVVYREVDVIAVVSGVSAGSHETGVIQMPAGVSAPTYCLVKPAADIVDPTLAYTIAWDAEIADASDLHDNVTNNSRITVPSGASLVRLKCKLKLAAFAADSGALVTIYKNGSAAYDGVGQATLDKAYYATPVLYAETAILVVSPTDYFQAVFDSADATVTIDASDSWFEMEILS